MTLDALLRTLIREALQEELRGFSQVRLPPANDNGSPGDAPMTTAQAARYCGFQDHGSDQEGVRLRSRLIPLGKRGAVRARTSGLGEALDAFLAGARGAIVPSGRQGAPPENTGGTSWNQTASGS